MRKKFTKGEKNKCKNYDWGKCVVQTGKRDCKPITENGIAPDKIEDCKLFESKEAKIDAG